MHYDSHKFIEKVCEQIGFKAAHKEIRQELEAHIEENIEQLIDEGFDEEIAIIKATEYMGDPIEIGESLNKVHRPQTEWGVISLVVLLSIFGVFITFFIGNLPNDSSYIYGIKHMAYTMIGMSFLWGIYFFDYMKLYKYSKYIFLVAINLTIATILFGINVNGTLYLKIGQVTFTTGAICNLMFMVHVISELSKCKGKGIIAFLKISSLSAVALISLFFIRAYIICFIMIIVYGILLAIAAVKGDFNYEERWNYLFVICGIGAVLLAIFINHMRLINNNLNNNEYLVYKYLEGAQWVGKSIFLNTNEWRPLPNQWVDYYLTITIANFGWIVGGVILSLLITLFIIMISRTLNLNNKYGFYLSLGITTLLIIKFILSVLIMVGYVNNLNCNLPFASFGGTSYFNDILVVGLFLAVWRRNLVVPSDRYSGLNDCN